MGFVSESSNWCRPQGIHAVSRFISYRETGVVVDGAIDDASMRVDDAGFAAHIYISIKIYASVVIHVGIHVKAMVTGRRHDGPSRASSAGKCNEETPTGDD